MKNIHQLNQTANRNAGKLFLIGIAVVAAYNWRLWQRDKALADRLRAEHKPLPKLSRTPKVSALVAAWNEAENIDAHIQSFLALDYPDIELVICAGGSDDTLAIARRYAGERVIVLEQHPGEGKQKGLARCSERASGEVIYLTDADCLFDGEALARLLAPIVQEGEHAATGASRPLDHQLHQLLPSYIWASDVVAGARSPRYVEGLLGRNAAITRVALDRSGGMDFEAHTGTDYQLARRLLRSGTNIRYIANSVVQSEYPTRLGEYQHKQSRWLRNLLLYGPRYGARRDVALTVRTVAIGIVMLLVPLLALPFGLVVLAAWAPIVAHAAMAKLRYALFAVRLHGQALVRRHAAASIPLTLLDFAVWASPVVELLNSEYRQRW